MSINTSTISYPELNYGAYSAPELDSPSVVPEHTSSNPAIPLYQPDSAEHPVYPQILTQPFHQQTRDLLTMSYALAEKINPILTARPSSTVPGMEETPATPKQMHVRPLSSPSISYNPVHIDLSDRSVRLFSNTTNVTNVQRESHTSSSKEEKEESNTATRVAVGLAGTAAVAGGGYLLGKLMAEGEEISQATTSFNRLKGHWNLNRSYPAYTFAYKRTVDGIIEQTDLILKRQHKNKIHKLGLLILGIAAGALCLGGALIGIKGLMVAGVALGVAVAALSLMKIAYNHFSKKEYQAACEIQRLHLDEEAFEPTV